MNVRPSRLCYDLAMTLNMNFIKPLLLSISSLISRHIFLPIALIFYSTLVLAQPDLGIAEESPAIAEESLGVGEENVAIDDQGFKTPICSSVQMDDIYAKNSNQIILRCLPLFAENAEISKKLIIEGSALSGMEMDCQGSTLKRGITIRSLRLSESDPWDRPSDIKISNCRSTGIIHVYGMAINGEGETLSVSSRNEGHTARVQNNAPTRIEFANIRSESMGAIPFYFGPGVTHSSIIDSHIAGKSNSVGIYFDAESANNIIRNNRISTQTRKRELIAIDGSATNLIEGNYFASLSNGGIYLYRNCGEGGNIRHQSPQNNRIQNNRFYYKRYWGWNPSIWIASRNGGRNYCNLDQGFGLGSSKSDLDYAQNNLIINNTFINKMNIRVNDQPNRVENNVRIKD